MNQMDIDISLLDNPYRFNAADKNYINFNGNSNSKNIRDAIRERHTIMSNSNFNGNSDLSMAHMLDDSMSNATGTSFTTITPSPSLSINPLAPRVTSFSSPTTNVNPIIPKILSPTSTTKTAILDTASVIKPEDLKLPSNYMVTSPSTSQIPTTTNTSNVTPMPINLGSGGGSGGGSIDSSSDESAKVAATEKKILGMKPILAYSLGGAALLAIGTFVYFKWIKK